MKFLLQMLKSGDNRARKRKDPPEHLLFVATDRQLWHPVQWRKTSYGTASEAGSRFVENVLTVRATCQLHQQNAFAYLTARCRAFFSGAVPPALIPQPS